MTTPTANADYFSFLESDTIFGNLLTNDLSGSIWNTSQLNYLDHQLINGKKAGAITDVAGEFGIFHVKLDGSFTYTLNEDAKAALLPGQTYTEHLIYKMSDGGGHTDVSYLTLDIKGYAEPAADKVLDFEGAVNPWDYEGFSFNFENSYIEAGKPGMKGTEGNVVTSMTGINFTRWDGQAFDLHSLDFGFTGGAVGVSAFAYTADGKWLQYYVDDMPANNMNHITLDWSNVVYAGISVNNDGTIEVSLDNVHIGSHDGLFV